MDNEEIELIKNSKPYLRFSIGEVVFLKSDENRERPLVIECLLGVASEFDYRAIWINAKNELQKEVFVDKVFQ